MKRIFSLLYIICFLHTSAQKINLSANSRTVFGLDAKKSSSITSGDIDGDGDIDVIIANGRHWPETNEVYFNNGLGKFSVSMPLDHLSETSYAAELSDFDGDGDFRYCRRE